MKFGKEFAVQTVPEWHDAYMDYNFLKLKLKDFMYFKSRKKPVFHAPNVPNSAGIKNTTTFRSFSGLMNRNRSPRYQSPRNEEEVILVEKKEHGKDHYETMFLMAAEEGGEYEVVFFKRLDEELNKVNTFYRSKVEELMKEATMLEKQMASLVAFRAIASKKPEVHFQTSEVENPIAATFIAPPKPDTYSGPAHMMVINEEEAKENETIQIESQQGRSPQREIELSVPQVVPARAPIHRPHPIDILKNVEIRIAPDTPRSTIRGILTNQENMILSRRDLRRGNEMVRTAFIEFYKKLSLLKSYSSLNLMAFSKIMKKYDKVTARRASRSYLHVVERSYLGSSEEVNKLIERVEATFTKHFASGNHSKAVNILRPTTKRQRHTVTFFIGFFGGCSISLLVALILLIVVRKIYNKDGVTRYMDSVFPLYSMFGFVFLHMFLYAADLYLWQRYRINYPFIFGFKAGTELGYRDVFLITSGLAVLSLAGAISSLNMNTQSLSTLAECVPLILLVILLLALFCPFKVLYHSSRFFLLRCAFHCLCAPFYKVLLPDFFLADQLTSQVQALRLVEYSICYYGWGHFRTRSNHCRDGDVYKTFYFIVALIPYWSRFLQCIRRLVEEKDAMQGYNAFKFFSIIIAVITRTTYSYTKQDAWRIMSFLTSTIATVVSIYWDIVIDWGLLQRNSQNPWLRDKLVVNQKSVYFIAMILNVLLRFAWIQSVMNFKIYSFHMNATMAIVACLEIIRRGIWNFFRLENEHLNNVGKYRAFKSVPLPFQHQDEDGDE